MHERLLSKQKFTVFFFFGARGTGKSYLIGQIFGDEQRLFINLLEQAAFDILNRDLEELSRRIESLPKTQKNWVIIDEIQRIPKPLNVVHHHLEGRNHKELRL